MRIIGILLLVAIAAFFGQFIFAQRKINNLYSQSTRTMLNDVPGAIRVFEPVMKMSDADTMGKASKTRREWARTLMRITIAKLNKSTFTPGDASNIEAALKYLKETDILSESERAQAHLEIYTRIAQTPKTLAEQGHLGDFDEFVRFLEKLLSAPILDEGVQAQLPALLAEARKIDRYPIALRTAIDEAKEGLRAGLQYLALKPPAQPGPVDVPIKADVSAWEPGAAEASFIAAYSSLEKFQKEWNPPALDPQVMRMLPVAHFNSAMTRVCYSLLGPRRRDGWNIYILPGVTPGEADTYTHRMNYLVGVVGQFQAALSNASFMPPDDPALPILQQVAQRGSTAGEILQPDGSIGKGQIRLVFLY